MHNGGPLSCVCARRPRKTTTRPKFTASATPVASGAPAEASVLMARRNASVSLRADDKCGGWAPLVPQTGTLCSRHTALSGPHFDLVLPSSGDGPRQWQASGKSGELRGRAQRDRRGEKKKKRALPIRKNGEGKKERKRELLPFEEKKAMGKTVAASATRNCAVIGPLGTGGRTQNA